MGSLGSIDLMELVDVINQSAEDGRLQVWMADPDEEEVINKLGFAGVLATDLASPVLGVYINDDTWAKMNWYLDLSTEITNSSVNADGTVTYDVTTTLTNVITEEEAYEAPAYVTGYSPMKRSVGDMYVKPLLVAPAGGNIANVMVVSGEGTMGEGTLYGFDVWSGAVNIGPQETVIITYQVTVCAQATSDLAVRQTPLGREL